MGPLCDGFVARGPGRAGSRAGGFLVAGLGASLATGAHARCPSTAVDLRAAADAAVSRFDAMDDAAFLAEVARVREQAGCLTEPVDPATAARVHAVLGLEAQYHARPDEALRALAAALEADPGFTFPATLAPDGSPLRVLTGQAKGAFPGLVPAVVDGGVLWVDGRVRVDRPTERPSLLQAQVGPAFVRSELVAAGAAPPAWVLEALEEPEREPRTAKGWWWATAAMGMTSASLWGAALVSESVAHASYADANPEALDLGQLERRVSAINGLGYAAQGGTVATGGLLTVTILVQVL